MLTTAVVMAAEDPRWETDFFDDFDSFDANNWQDQRVWTNDEDQCYVPDGEFGTREVSDGTLKLRVVDLGEPYICDTYNKAGELHPPTRYVSARIITKNRQEFVQGRWNARLRVRNSGEDGMFPAWWLLGAYNNEAPVEDPDETVCWPMVGSGEIDIMEHHSDGGPDHYAARAIDNEGFCGGGDWRGAMLVQESNLAEYHEYGVEFESQDMIFLLDGEEIYRIAGYTERFPEPLFAILNFAKINDSTMRQTWEMEVDWVKHERRVDASRDQ